MKFTAATIALLSTLAFADDLPVTVNGLDGFTIQCGKTQFQPVDLQNAVAKGANLQDQGAVYTSSAGSMRTYPRQFRNNEMFPDFKSPEQCDGTSTDQPGRDEFPLMNQGKVFADMTPQGVFRIIYTYNGEKADGMLTAYYCGSWYHDGSNTLPCDITKPT